MKPEKGDPNVTVTAEDVCMGFESVGAVKGDTVIYHGALSSMGRVIGGAAAVIEGVRAAVGAEGTVAMPTLWYHRATPPLNPEDWNIETSPSYVGKLSEVFRTHPDSVRSNNFSHSVSAIGARAAELVAGHGSYGEYLTPWNAQAFADASPWRKLYDWNALYCFIGVNFQVLTMKHYMEARVVDEILHWIKAEERPRFIAELSQLNRPGIWPFFDSEKLEARLADLGMVRYSKIGCATLRAIRTKELVDVTMPMLRTNDEWYKEDFLNWRNRIKAAAGK